MKSVHLLTMPTLCCVLFLFLCSEIHGQRPSSPLEITEVDLFGTKDWNSTGASILGLMLGMNRQDCFKVILKWNGHLDDAAGQRCIKARSCYVSRWDGYTGMSIDFDDNDDLEKIRIEACRFEVTRGDSISWIARNFLGETSRFVRLYSEDLTDAENLRAQILGHPSSVKRSNIQTIDYAHNEYWYGRLGLVVILDVDNNRRTEKLVLEFIRPHVN